MNTVEVLDGAIGYIEANGWCKNELYTEKGQACIRGALYFGAGSQFTHITLEDGSTMGVMDDDTLDRDAYMVADQLVVDQIREEFDGEAAISDIPDFNDADETTQEDAVALLKRAREKALADLRN